MIRPVASVVFGAALAVASIRLAGCFVNPTPPNPHEMPDGGDPPEMDPPAPADAVDASEAG